MPLCKRDAGKYATALEMVRLAPSAVNTQPWRVIRRDDDFHFFAEKTRYYHLIRSNFLCRNDLGIALAHFELTCRELGLEGNWIIDKESNDTFPGWEYIRTWKGN